MTRTAALALGLAVAMACGGLGPSEAGPGEPDAVAATPLALDHRDEVLQRRLERAIAGLDLGRLVAERRLGVALVELLPEDSLRYAGVNDDVMLYAASLPKIAALLAAFEAIEAGRIEETPRFDRTLTEMIRVSSNPAATEVVDRVGFEAIATTLQRPRYRLYDPAAGGGIWLGKAYDPRPAVVRDPLHGISHGATARQAARFFTLLDRGLLVSPERSRQMKSILGDPGIRHKFVRGLLDRPAARIFRKSGTYRTHHADAALVEHAGRRYVAAAIVDDARGETILQRLILALDDLVVGAQGGAAPGTPVANASQTGGFDSGTAGRVR